MWRHYFCIILWVAPFGEEIEPWFQRRAPLAPPIEVHYALLSQNFFYLSQTRLLAIVGR